MRNFLLCTTLVLLFLSLAASASVPVTGITLDKQDMVITVGGIVNWPWKNLISTVLPADATNQNVIWSSSNEAVAWVSGINNKLEGSVRGESPGIATITVTTEDGGFKDTCTVTVISSDVYAADFRHSSDKSEVALKMVGFSESDFEIIDGNVVIKKSIAETIAKKLLGTNDIEVILIPWFEAGVMSGKVAAVSIMQINEKMFNDYPENPEFLLLSIISPDTGAFLGNTGYQNNDIVDGNFVLDSIGYFTGSNITSLAEYVLIVLNRDGGKYDLDKSINGSVSSQLAIVKRVKEEEEGCNVGFGSSLLMLIGIALLVTNRKKFIFKESGKR